MKPCILLDGAFDPLHAGHVNYIQNARWAFQDRGELIVSVCDDASIRAKGREPLFDQDTRLRVVESIKGVDRAVLKTVPTEALIGQLKPALYVKGNDWLDKLPAEQLAACSLYGVQIAYMDTVTHSSSAALRRWALSDAERGLSRLETFMAAQSAPEPWQPVTDYSFEARKQVEGPHAELILRWLCRCEDADILDYGCGPGHLVRMINEHPERGQVAAAGYDPRAPEGVPHVYTHVPADQPAWDLVICREVLEHCTVMQAAEVVRTLFRLSAGYVYITTRFTDAGVFDAGTEFDVDPTHITCLSQPFLRALCVLNGGKLRRDLETKLDHQKKGRVLCYEVGR